MSVLVNLFRNRTHFQLLLKSLYTPVLTTQCTEIASMLTEHNKTQVKENIYLFLQIISTAIQCEPCC